MAHFGDYGQPLRHARHAHLKSMPPSSIRQSPRALSCSCAASTWAPPCQRRPAATITHAAKACWARKACFEITRWPFYTGFAPTVAAYGVTVVNNSNLFRHKFFNVSRVGAPATPGYDSAGRLRAADVARDPFRRTHFGAPSAAVCSLLSLSFSQRQQQQRRPKQIIVRAVLSSKRLPTPFQHS